MQIAFSWIVGLWIGLVDTCEQFPPVFSCMQVKQCIHPPVEVNILQKRSRRTEITMLLWSVVPKYWQLIQKQR